MDRETLRKRIAALSQRTTARGCTEAEAMEAAAKAAALLSEHNMSEDELDMAEEAAGVKTASNAPGAMLWPVIATCTNTAALSSRRDGGRIIIFIGREPGPVIAVYLLDVCENAVRSELSKFRKGEFYRRRRSDKTKRHASRDFTAGLSIRLRDRLLELFIDTCSENEMAKAKAERDRRFPHSVASKSYQHKPKFSEATTAGWRAGATVNLAHGVEGHSQPQLLITGGR